MLGRRIKLCKWSLELFNLSTRAPALEKGGTKPIISNRAARPFGGAYGSSCLPPPPVLLYKELFSHSPGVGKRALGELFMYCLVYPTLLPKSSEWLCIWFPDGPHARLRSEPNMLGSGNRTVSSAASGHVSGLRFSTKRRPPNAERIGRGTPLHSRSSPVLVAKLCPPEFCAP